MPNICTNYLRIGGPHETALGVLTKLKDGGFNAFIPEPPDADVDWRKANWGDKWDIDPEESDFDLENLKALFSTAWSPPTIWFQHVAKEFPTLILELHYEESGACLWGWMKSEGGVLTTASEEPLLDMDEGDSELMINRGCEWYFDQQTDGQK